MEGIDLCTNSGEEKNKEWSSDEPFKGSSGRSDSQELREKQKVCVAEQILILLIQVNGRKDPEGCLKCKMKMLAKSRVGYCVTLQSESKQAM